MCESAIHMSTPTTTTKTVRAPVQLLTELARAARANERSLNGEIVYRLRQTLAARADAQPKERTR
jgi:hypothetical protein